MSRGGLIALAIFMALFGTVMMIFALHGYHTHSKWRVALASGVVAYFSSFCYCYSVARMPTDYMPIDWRYLRYCAVTVAPAIYIGMDISHGYGFNWAVFYIALSLLLLNIFWDGWHFDAPRA